LEKKQKGKLPGGGGKFAVEKTPSPNFEKTGASASKEEIYSLHRDTLRGGDGLAVRRRNGRKGHIQGQREGKGTLRRRKMTPSKKRTPFVAHSRKGLGPPLHVGKKREGRRGDIATCVAKGG